MEHCSAVGSLFWLYRLDPFHLESNHAKLQLNPLRNSWYIVCFSVQRFFGAAWNTAVLQGCCFGLRLDPFDLQSYHAKYQLNQLRIGWDIGCLVFGDTATALWTTAVLQCHWFDPRLVSFNLESHHAKFHLNLSNKQKKFSSILWEMAETYVDYLVFINSAVLHGILQCCAAGSLFWL